MAYAPRPADDAAVPHDAASGDGQAVQGDGQRDRSRTQALAERPFRLADWTVVPRAHELMRPGETVRVDPRPMAVLLYLAERAGEVVTRDELMESVWEGVYVSEHALNRCISQLRKLWEDDARDPRIIETIPKTGYRLIAPVERLGDGIAAPLDALDVRVTASPASSAKAEGDDRKHWVVGALVLVGVALLVALLMPRSAQAPVTRAFTTALGVENGAAWSPDGTRLAYVHAADGQRCIMVKALGDDSPRALTSGPFDTAPAWSPDGARIAFTRCDSLGCRPYSVPALGGTPQRLADVPVWSQGLAWPEASTLIAPAPPGEEQGLLRIALATGTTARLTASGQGFLDVGPVISPDGRAVLFVRQSMTGGDLYRVPLAGGDAQRLTDEHRVLAGHSWTADGRALLFSSDRSGVFALWRIPAEGGTPEAVLGVGARDPGGVRVAPSGERLVVEDWQFEINLWRYTENTAPQRIVSSTLWDKHPHLAPDGSRLVFVSNRTGPPEVWIAGGDGQNPLRLTDFGASVAHPRLSPDGRSVVFSARRETQADLYVVAAEGGPPRRLTTHAADDVAPRWSRDGQRIYFGSNRSGTWQLWRVHADGGEAAQVTAEGGYTAAEDAEGSLLVTRFDEPGLWRVTEGTERRVADLPARGDWGSWALTERGVLVLERLPDGTSRLARIDLSTGRHGPWNEDTVDALVYRGEAGVTASADGSTVVVARTERTEADLLLVAPFE